ncbi:MAG: hypothetical protein HQ582_08980, partial [Planctomycetes bacterium]|nr:hypothetical protein [Planctomycetota bacterium]
MAIPFDPYHTWLGIPPEEQPPNHYRLLGITLFESNPDVISNASDRQMLLLRTFQAGKRSTLSQKLLNAVAVAKVCLLNPDKKTAYDERLRRDLDEQQATEPAGMEAQLFDFEPTAASAVQPTGPRRRKLRWDSPKVIAGAAGGAALVFLVVVFTLSSGPGDSADLTSEEIAPPTVDDEVTPPIKVRKKERPTVKPAAKPPVLAAIPDQAVSAGKRINVSIDVADPGDPRGELEFSLRPGAPPDMRINPKSGRITWRPAEDSPAGEFPVTLVVVSDSPGNPTDETSFVVRVSAGEPARA